MSSDPTEYLRHMLQEAEYLLAQSGKLTKEVFLQDETLKRAFARSIEVLGEAAKQVPASFREQHAQLPWKGMAGMRDRLIHGYFGVDYDLVWDVVTNKVPEVQAGLLRLLKTLPPPADETAQSE